MVTSAGQFVLDLETLKFRTHFVPVVGKNFQDRVFTKVEAINDGSVLFFSKRSNMKFHLMPVSSDKTTGMEYVKKIEPLTKLEMSNLTSKAGTLKKLQEVKKGLCVFEVETGCTSLAALLFEGQVPSAKFIIETIAWKG